jgi:hypothetical protein
VSRNIRGSANNNPTVQDVWNTIPAWRFPYISSTLAPMPTASTFIEGVYAQQVVGVSAYTFLDDMLYVELGAYRPLSTRTQLALGVDTTGQSPISGIAAPYWRVAVEPNFGINSLETGTFGLRSNALPMGMSSAGTDSFTDIGVDTQYQYLGDPHTVTLRASWIRENRNLDASQGLGLSDNSHDVLRSLNASVSYIYDHTWSFTAGRISIGGTADPALCGTFTGSPNSGGWITEIAYLPFSYGGPTPLAVDEHAHRFAIHAVGQIRRRQHQLQRSRPKCAQQQHDLRLCLDHVLIITGRMP